MFRPISNGNIALSLQHIYYSIFYTEVTVQAGMIMNDSSVQKECDNKMTHHRTILSTDAFAVYIKLDYQHILKYTSKQIHKRTKTWRKSSNTLCLTVLIINSC